MIMAENIYVYGNNAVYMAWTIPIYGKRTEGSSA